MADEKGILDLLKTTPGYNGNAEPKKPEDVKEEIIEIDEEGKVSPALPILFEELPPQKPWYKRLFGR